MSYNVIKSEDLTFPKIKEKINKAGNLFYQYRACRRDAATIYDIENIRHGVVYARTPLQMNDPYDSAVDSLDENLKLVIKSLLKYRLIGKTVEFIDALNKLKKYIFAKLILSKNLKNAMIQKMLIQKAMSQTMTDFLKLIKNI